MVEMDYLECLDYQVQLVQQEEMERVVKEICAVCYISTRVTLLMLPARLTCPTNWTLEYNGYLMSERYSHHRSTFECIDEDLESIPGSHASTDPALFFYNEATCNGLPCPPYDTQKEITCAVCSK